MQIAFFPERDETWFFQFGDLARGRLPTFVAVDHDQDLGLLPCRTDLDRLPPAVGQLPDPFVRKGHILVDEGSRPLGAAGHELGFFQLFLTAVCLDRLVQDRRGGGSVIGPSLARVQEGNEGDGEK